MKKSLHCILSSFFLLTTTILADWHHWRGPTQNGISSATNLPDSWSEAKNLLWKIPLPAPSSSTPVIVGNKIFLTVDITESVHKATVQLLCISTEGVELWRRKISDVPGGYKNGESNFATPSPSADRNHIYVMTGTGVVAAFTHTGEKKWSFNVQEKYGKFKLGFGYHVTPVLHEKALYIQLINTKYQIVLGIEAETGQRLWKVNRPSDGKVEALDSYASPTAIRYGSTNVVITHGHDYTIGHDPRTGKELWRIGDLNPRLRYNRSFRFVASPVTYKNLIIAPTAKNGCVAAVDLTKAKGFIPKGGNAEEWRISKGTPDVPSPLIYNGLVYLCRENGVGICLDAKTGEKYYEARVYTQDFRSSPVAAAGKVFFTARDGTVSVLKAGKKFEIISQNKLDDQFTASTAISDNRLYLRGYKSLYCIGKK